MVSRKDTSPKKSPRTSSRVVSSGNKNEARTAIRCWDENGHPVPDFSAEEQKLGALKEQVMIRLGALIAAKGWSQSTAGEILEVAQPRISDLIRGRYSKFSLDTLVTWLFKLEQDVSIAIESSAKEWSYAKMSHAETIDFYSRAIALEPENTAHYHNRGDAYLALKQFDLAIGDYTRCIELEPDRLGPRNNRALAYLNSGQLRACINDCEKLIAQQPMYSGGYAHRAVAYEQMEKFDSALSDYSKVTELDFDRPGPYWNRASFYNRLGKYKNARADLEKLLEIDATAVYARELLKSLPNDNESNRK